MHSRFQILLLRIVRNLGGPLFLLFVAFFKSFKFLFDLFRLEIFECFSFQIQDYKSLLIR